MSYSTSTPPRIKVAGVSGSPNWWEYASADPHATVDASGYFTNGYDLGMRDGDQILIIDTNLKISSWHYIEILTGTTINLADGTVVGSTTNTD